MRLSVIAYVCIEDLYVLAEPGRTVNCYYANFTVIQYTLS